MKFRERYLFDPSKDFIGKGGFSKVFKAYDTIRKRTVALKFYTGTESEKYDIISEINRMDNIVHPNLVRYYDANIIDSVNALGEKEQIQVGIMEYADSGDIGTFFSTQRPPDVTRNIIMGILNGICYLHNSGIAHRDLKPKNILLSTENGVVQAKIGDFGISKKVDKADDISVSSQLLGSVEYMAPEQFAPAVYGLGSKLGTNADLWSLGIILYEIFTQQLPFGSRTKGITYEQILNNILFQELSIDYDAVPEPYRSIIRRCLVKSAVKRAQHAEELVAILEGKKYEPADEGSTTAVFDNLNPQKSDYTNSNYNNVSDNKEQGSETSIITPNGKTDEKKTSDNNDRYKNENNNNTVKPLIVETPVYERPLQKSNSLILNEINTGKNLFRSGNYPESFQILDRYLGYEGFDTEAKFYLGFMYYNGKCGGAHDPVKGSRLMNEAKRENRPLVLELMLKYVLRK